MKQWTVPARLIFSADVLIEAETKEEAMERAENGEFDDMGLAGASLADWTVMGTPKESK